MSWSRLAHTDLGAAARAQYQSDHRRHYHNWGHVMRLYHHAEHTLCLPYDEALDAAILGHDVIYDALPDKEVRSADWLSAQDPDLGALARPHILRTIDHMPSRDNRMALLDLMDMRDPEVSEMNFDLIRLESRQLYGISDAAFAEANLAFSRGMIARFSDKVLTPLSPGERDIYTGVRTGLAHIVSLAEGLRARAT